ncbi:jg10714 [Pararge aegeria aegeria]|uniref:Jg10714 protein n=1 Tax=Pararge aegeria aegeria TaxID=348720 RepID=A0A8S4RKE8_9NEOP|nr:jg10714 [Pararge aegeria aegeria]
MGGAHSLENRWTLGFQGARNGDPAPINAALVGPQRGGQTTSKEPLGAAGNKRPRTVDFGTPYKRPMSSSGLQPVKVMMMMMNFIRKAPFGHVKLMMKTSDGHRNSTILSITRVALRLWYIEGRQFMHNIRNK